MVYKKVGTRSPAKKGAAHTDNMEQKGQRQAMAALRTTGITHAEPGAPLVMYVHCTMYRYSTSSGTVHVK